MDKSAQNIAQSANIPKVKAFETFSTPEIIKVNKKKVGRNEYLDIISRQRYKL
jgi:hypothetical protein